MNILILEQPCDAVEAISDRLTGLGHDVQPIAALGRAMTLARIDPPDLLITALFPEGEGTGAESGLSVALAAQFHNPDLVTILLSDSLLFSQGELFSMLGSLRCIMRRPPPVDDLIEVAAHFLANGPVNCAPSATGPDICRKCALTDVCSRAEHARAAMEGRKAAVQTKPSRRIDAA